MNSSIEAQAIIDKVISFAGGWVEAPGDDPSLVTEIADEISRIRAASLAEGFAQAANEVPTSWLDSLLARDAVLKGDGGTWGCPDIERLLRAVKARILAASPDPNFVTRRSQWFVWSNEHHAWWKPNQCGYVRDITLAGTYSFDEATTICRDANRGVRTNEPPYETMVLAAIKEQG